MAAFNTVTKYGSEWIIGKHFEEQVPIEEWVDYSITRFPQKGSATHLMYNTDLVSVVMPNTTYATYSFKGCSNLKNVTMPKLQTVGREMFIGTGIESIDLPSATSIDQQTFANCTQLKHVNLPLVGQGSYSSFTGCTALEEIHLPSYNYGVYNNAMFRGCTSLKVVDLPKLVIMNDGFLESCSSLENVTLPSANWHYTNASLGHPHNVFRYCASLRRVYLPAQTYSLTGNNMFSGCNKLEILRMPAMTGTVSSATALGTLTSMKLLDLGFTTAIDQAINTIPYTRILILRNTDAIVTLADTSVFTAETTPSPIKIFVPSSLKSAYENGTNWSTLVANNYVSFHNLEGSFYEDPDFDDTAIYNADRSTL